jgi:hypothetical protein
MKIVEKMTRRKQMADHKKLLERWSDKDGMFPPMEPLGIFPPRPSMAKCQQSVVYGRSWRGWRG